MPRTFQVTFTLDDGERLPYALKQAASELLHMASVQEADDRLDMMFTEFPDGWGGRLFAYSADRPSFIEEGDSVGRLFVKDLPLKAKSPMP